jgi:hypothetical protein
MRILYLTNGRVHDENVRRTYNAISLRSICSASRINLFRYDIIIIPSYSNQDVLMEVSSRLMEFVRCGGVLVALGACQDKQQWLPFCNYHRKFQTTIEFRNTDSNDFKAIFKNICDMKNREACLDRLRMHDKFYSHGFFTCFNTVSTPLLAGNEPCNEVFTITTPHRFAGKILVTTLDPDYHAVSGFARDNMEAFAPAIQLFDNIVEWAKTMVVNQHAIIAFFKRVKGISTIALVYLIAIATSISTIAVLCMLGTVIKGEPTIALLGIVGSIASIISLVLSMILIKKY